ncbi:MAG: DUF4065 domain-containing protein [Alphaproteobacteria bacterium]|nr:DUF4065 domain-containing protein [Alphaproteobacteria bacterium]
MYPGMLVADYVIWSGEGKFTPLQIGKLVYISHGYTLALENRRLVRDRIEAWKYGPVVPAIYHALKHNGGSRVSRLQYCNTGVDSESMRERVDFFKRVIDQKDRDIIKRVLVCYGHLTGRDLSRITHAKGTPWSECYRPDQLHIRIPDPLIKKHYEGLLASSL